MTLRRPIFAGNWKMNTTASSAQTLAQELSALATASKNQATILICPPYPFLIPCKQSIEQSPIQLGAQDVSPHPNGAFTGDISAEMLTSVGCTHVIIGHSERRQYHAETNALLAQKTSIAIAHHLHVIFCIGESESERENALTFKVLAQQLKECLGAVTSPLTSDTLSIAYEPIWAIGTGKVATKDQAQETHRFIRDTLTTLLGHDTAQSIRILYGGSVKPSNAQELLSQPDIDGALVGGASLNASDFTSIITAGVHSK